eukprot:scaffold21120_cov28-Tisochrysis_lutea.AAC.2
MREGGRLQHCSPEGEGCLKVNTATGSGEWLAPCSCSASVRALSASHACHARLGPAAAPTSPLPALTRSLVTLRATFQA